MLLQCAHGSLSFLKKSYLKSSPPPTFPYLTTCVSPVYQHFILALPSLDGCCNICRLFHCTCDNIPNESMYTFKASLVSFDFPSLLELTPPNRFSKQWSHKNEWAGKVKHASSGESPQNNPSGMITGAVSMARCQAPHLTQWAHWLMLWWCDRPDNELWGERDYPQPSRWYVTGLGFETRCVTDREDHNLNQSPEFCWTGILLNHLRPQHYCFLQCLRPYTFFKKWMNDVSVPCISKEPQLLFSPDLGPVPHIPSLSPQLYPSLYSFLPRMNRQNIPGVY